MISLLFVVLNLCDWEADIISYLQTVRFCNSVHFMGLLLASCEPSFSWLQSILELDTNCHCLLTYHIFSMTKANPHLCKCLFLGGSWNQFVANHTSGLAYTIKLSLSLSLACSKLNNPNEFSVSCQPCNRLFFFLLLFPLHPIQIICFLEINNRIKMNVTIIAVKTRTTWTIVEKSLHMSTFVYQCLPFRTWFEMVSTLLLILLPCTLGLIQLCL